MSAPRSGDPAAASRLLGLLAEPDRLRVAAALILGAETPAAIRASTGLDARAVATAVARLSAGGLVIDHDGSLLLDEPQLKAAAASAASPRDIDDHGAIDQGAASVLRTFLRDGRLASIPAAHAKRRVVLDHIARAFEIGRRYPEPEVDALLRVFHPDYAALRRYLVDEEFLDRAGGVYWRAGGSVEV